MTVAGVTLLVLLVVLVDLVTWQRFLKRYHRLNHEGHLESVEQLLLSEMRTFRPFIRPVLGFKFPGGLEIFLCNVLYQLGRTGEALDAGLRAERKAGKHRKLGPEALHLQVLCLTELQRYDEARAAAARGRAIDTVVGLDIAEAGLALVLGRFDEAIELGTRAAADRRGYIGRCIASSALNCQGKPQAALALLQENPPGIWVHYTEKNLKTLERTGSGRELLDLHQKQWSGVVEPLRFLYAASIYAELKELDALRYALDRAGASMGGHPAVRSMHQRLGLLLAAGLGDVEGTDRALAESRRIVDAPTTRATKAEFHRSAGRALLALGRGADAMKEFDAALQISVHPLEKHINRFWLARANDVRGEKEKAAELFKAVAADGIVSKYAAEAALYRP